MSDLVPIGLPSWRQDAIARTVGMYDAEDVNGEALIKLKRGAGDIERFNAMIDLLSEVYPEAAALVRNSKATPKNRLTAALARLNEISLEGREFAEVKPGQYDWRDRQDDLEEKLEASVKAVKAKPKGERTSSPKVDDDYVKQVVKSTAPKKPTTSRSTKPKTQVKQSRATKTTRTRAAK